jgi:MFS family permease
MKYLGEFRVNWRYLLGGAIGLGSGLSLQSYITSVFAPYLLKDFGWSKADFALTGMMGIALVVCFPIIGRITDTIGVRRTAAVGIVFGPLLFLAMSALHGPISEFFVIYFLQGIFGATTTTIVYSRLAAIPFERARGFALSIIAAAPAVVGATCAPLMTQFIEEYGWRAGFQFLAAFMFGFGVLTLILIPRSADAHALKPKRAAKQDYRAMLRMSVFWIMFVAVLLANLAQVMHASQLKLLLLAKGVSSSAAATMFSIYAVGVMVGRFGCGIALDRFPAHVVAALGLAVPSIGEFLLASNLSAPEVLGIAMFTLGLMFGAEGDVLGYLVVRYFGVDMYGSVLGILTAVIGLSLTIGSMVLSATLRAAGDYGPFLTMCAIAALAGGGLLLLLGRRPVASTEICGQGLLTSQGIGAGTNPISQ